MLPKPEVPAIARKTTKHSVHILIITEKCRKGWELFDSDRGFYFLVKLLAIVYQGLTLNLKCADNNV